jgi:hypothetical protein
LGRKEILNSGPDAPGTLNSGAADIEKHPSALRNVSDIYEFAVVCVNVSDPLKNPAGILRNVSPCLDTTSLFLNVGGLFRYMSTELSMT